MKNYKYILTHSSGNLTVEYNPLNWDKFNTMFKRSERYHSILRREIVDTEFPLDGKEYIDTIYQAYGIDTSIGCEIQYLNRSTWAYATLFDGEIDLSEWSWLRDTTSVKIIDSSRVAKFAARDEIEIPLNWTDDLNGDGMGIDVSMDDVTVYGVNIEEKAEFLDANNDIAITDIETNTNWNDKYGISDDGYDYNTIGADAVLPGQSIGPLDTGILYTNNTGASQYVRYRVVINIDADIQVTGTGGWEWYFKMYLGKNAVSTPIDESASGAGADLGGFLTAYDTGYVTIELADTDTLNIYFQWNGIVDALATITPNITISPVRIEVFTVVIGEPSTVVSMPLLHELTARMLEIMTGQTDPLGCDLFGRTDSWPRTYGTNGDYSLYGVATGLMFRGFPHADFPLKTTFWDLFKSIDALFNLGLWYNGTDFEIKEKADYYKVESIITLGEVKDLEISVAADHYFNRVLAGYRSEVSYEDVNGQQMPNVPVEFVNPGFRVQNTLDIQSVFRGDDYGIELSRKEDYATTVGEDTAMDNDKFFLELEKPGATYQAKTGNDFTAITGVYAPDSRMNMGITPKRNALRHANRLSIPLFISEADTRFARSQFELALGTQDAGEASVLYERDDIAYIDLEEPLYYPEVYNFTAELTLAHILQLISDPHGYVEFDYLGTTYSGYILEVSSQPFRKQGNWTLIKRNPNRV